MSEGHIDIHRDLSAYRSACDAARSRSERVGLVPTMGALHSGHVALIQEALRRSKFVVVSIFVNPTQFGPNEDFARYPRPFERDVEACKRAGASCVFAPSVDGMYPPGDETRVRVDSLAAPFCGVHRPGHFEGVATIVAKLFALTGPCVAVFGRKDYQQLRVVERMARDLLLAVEVVGHPTLREPDGLAISSRNVYLSPDDRLHARQIPLGLSHAVQAFHRGVRNAGRLCELVRSCVSPVSSQIDYIDIADALTLKVFDSQATIGDRAVIAVAARVGPARLIDNVVLGEDSAPCPEA